MLALCCYCCGVLAALVGFAHFSHLHSCTTISFERLPPLVLKLTGAVAGHGAAGLVPVDARATAGGAEADPGGARRTP
jgi:hypothetical protein